MSFFTDFSRGLLGLPRANAARQVSAAPPWAAIDQMGFWAAMREDFRRGRAGLPFHETDVERTMREAYAAAKGQRESLSGAPAAAARFGDELSAMDRAWAWDWMRYARSPDFRTAECHAPAASPRRHRKWYNLRPGV
jgi:hypothetical protein